MMAWLHGELAHVWMPLAVAALFVALALARGRSLGLHQLLTGHLPGHTEAISVALSQIHYGEGSNYTGNMAVHDALIAAGLHPNLAETRISHDGPAMNKALAAAAGLPMAKVLNADRRFLQFDLGYVDFARLAFRLFGIRIESLYYCYFALLSASMAVFAAAFRDQSAYLWCLAIFAGAFYLLLYRTAILADINMETVHDWRFFSTLALVPGSHLMLLQLSGTALGPQQLALLLLQAWLLAFVIRVRYAASWVFVPIVLAGAWAMATGPAHQLARGLGAWPAILGLVVLAWCSWRFRRRLHPIYRSPEAIPKYPMWHSVFLGFALDRQTWGRNQIPGDEEGFRDWNAIRRVHHYFQEHPERVPQGGIAPAFPWKSCIMQIDIKWGLYEDTIRLVTFDYLRRNLTTMPRLYLWLKPLHYHKTLLQILAKAFTRPWSGVDGLVLALSALATWGLLVALQGGGAGPILALAGLLLAGAAIPHLWAYTLPHGLADQAWVQVLSLWLLLALLGFRLLS